MQGGSGQRATSTKYAYMDMMGWPRINGRIWWGALRSYYLYILFLFIVWCFFFPPTSSPLVCLILRGTFSVSLSLERDDDISFARAFVRELIRYHHSLSARDIYCSKLSVALVRKFHFDITRHAGRLSFAMVTRWISLRNNFKIRSLHFKLPY